MDVIITFRALIKDFCDTSDLEDFAFVHDGRPLPETTLREFVEWIIRRDGIYDFVDELEFVDVHRIEESE